MNREFLPHLVPVSKRVTYIRKSNILALKAYLGKKITSFDNYDTLWDEIMRTRLLVAKEITRRNEKNIQK